MQLALYARSQRYDVRGGTRTPLDVDTTRGLVIHLPAGAGQCELKWADLSIGWSGVQIAKDVWDWRGLSGQLEATPPGWPDQGSELFEIIAVADDPDFLRRLYLKHRTTWTEMHTAAAKRRIAELESSSPAPAA
jgi:hypothetical protein